MPFQCYDKHPEFGLKVLSTTNNPDWGYYSMLMDVQANARNGLGRRTRTAGKLKTREDGDREVREEVRRKEREEGAPVGKGVRKKYKSKRAMEEEAMTAQKRGTGELNF